MFCFVFTHFMLKFFEKIDEVFNNEFLKVTTRIQNLIESFQSFKTPNMSLNFNFSFFQGQAICQLCRTIKDVQVIGICSKSKHEALKATGLIDHLLERGSDYSNEVRK